MSANNEKSKVFFCSAKQNKLVSEETLPKKLDKILENLKIFDRVKNEKVVIKMHLAVMSDIQYFIPCSSGELFKQSWMEAVNLL